MIGQIDNFFVRALQEEGYDIDFKKLRDAYIKSRQYPEQKARARLNREINRELSEIDFDPFEPRTANRTTKKTSSTKKSTSTTKKAKK